MSFNWENYLILAADLARSNTEAHLRSAVSRAYYGVFCVARNKTVGKDYKQSDVHRRVIELLKNDQNKALKNVGWKIDELRKKRNDADYDEDAKIDPHLVTRCINKARVILKTLTTNQIDSD